MVFGVVDRNVIDSSWNSQASAPACNHMLLAYMRFLPIPEQPRRYCCSVDVGERWMLNTIPGMSSIFVFVCSVPELDI